MKKFSTLLLALIACAGTMFADGTKIGDLYYNLNANNKTAEVTYQIYKSIGNYSDLTSANIPSYVTYNDETYSVTSIGEGAFRNCSGLTSITIPTSVTSIGGSAFESCTGLTSVTIPNSVTSIGYSAFYNVPNIVYFGTATGSPWYARCINGYVEGYLVYSDDTKTNLLACSTAATGEIVLPNSVTSIGGDWAFYYCSGLTSITIPNSVTSIGVGAFCGCSGLTSIEIPNSVTSIGSYAFADCSGFLTSVTIPNSVTSIGNYAFRGCMNLTKVVAPAAIFDLEESQWIDNTKQLDSVVINSGELTENALGFIKRSYKTLRTLDAEAVTNTSLPDEAFKGCYNLRSLVLPAGLEQINYMAVADCKNLQSIDIPASVEEIDQSAFENCRSLKTVTFGGVLPSSAPGRSYVPASSTSQLRKIGNWAFYNAHELQHLEIPEGVTEIGDGAFYGCTYLEDLTLPSSIQSIGDNCFALCAKMGKITVNSVTPPTIATKTFYDVKRQIPVYVPDECVTAYKNDDLWGEFDIQGQSKMPTAIDNINDGAVKANGQKILRDGQILIIRGDKTYTLQGQEVR